MTMPAREIWDFYTRVGFGQKPQIDFPGRETGGCAAWQSWRPIDQATVGFGYGVSVSLMQLAQATPSSRATATWCRSRWCCRKTPSRAAGAGSRSSRRRRAHAVRKMLAMVTQPGGNGA